MADKFLLKEVELLENGRGSDFAFLEKIQKQYKSSRHGPLRTMRFYRYHADYIGYKDIGYLGFRTVEGCLELEIPVNDLDSTKVLIFGSTLKELHLEYRTTYLPEKYKKKGSGKCASDSRNR